LIAPIQVVKEALEKIGIYARAVAANATYERSPIQTDKANVGLLYGRLLLKKCVEGARQRRLTAMIATLNTLDPFQEPAVVNRQEMHDVVDGGSCLERR
jgi:hypothetical protein